jgi:thiamine biosynthesis lipoprotein
LAGRRSERAVLAEIERLDAIFSTYRDDSELSRWQADGPSDALVSPELAEVLDAAAFWKDRTEGAFDPKLPASTGITLDAIAKGYIVDRACSVAMHTGRASDVILDIGGDLRHMGERPAIVGVGDPYSGAENARPIERISIRNEGVATSGGLRRGRWLGRRRESHLVDPRTGISVEHVLSASVIGPSSTIADVLATAFCVLQPRESCAIADSISGVGCLLVRADGARISNPTWDRHVLHDPSHRPISRRRALTGALGASLLFPRGSASSPSPSSSPGSQGPPRSHRAARIPWDERFELVISFGFGDPRGGMAARRPYVVIYIDDADANPVRTVSLWAQDASWIRQLRRWFRGERARQAEQDVDIIGTVTTPTRSPGSYSVVWDGRNDLGELVEQGEYFVCLETIRQGGSVYFTRAPFTFESTPFEAQMEDYGTFRDIQLSFRERA